MINDAAVSPPAPDIVYRLASDSYFDHGLLSVKFKALSGRVVFFRPFVQRKTSTGRYVDRVVFVVADKGELIIADVDASPKRAVMLSSVTSILVDGSTVALLFEKSTVEHDVQLMFCPAPSLPGSKSSTPAVQPAAASDEPSATEPLDPKATSTVNSRVLFADGASVHSPAATNTPSNPSYELLDESVNGAIVPLMTLKHFVHCVRFFSPHAQVILGASADVDMNLKKPKHFSAPAGTIGGEGDLAPLAFPDEMNTSQRQPLFQVVSIPARGEDDGTDGTHHNAAAGKKSFKEVYNATHGIAAEGAEDEKQQFMMDFGMSVPQQSDAAAPEERRSLRDIAAQGKYHNHHRGEEIVDHDPQDVIPYYHDENEDAYPPVEEEGAYDDGARYDDETEEMREPFDPHPDATNIAEMSNYAPVSSSYDGVSPPPRAPDAYSPGSSLPPQPGYDAMSGYAAMSHNGNSGAEVANEEEPLLSDMVRKLRARRGEIQMQNLMIQGEINGMQKNAHAIESSHQVDNDPEFAYHSIYEPRRSQRPRTISFVTDEQMDEQDEDDVPAARVMVCSKDYNRSINLSLVVLNICRRQRQIHLHAERDARQMKQFTDRKHGGGRYYDGMYVSSGALGLFQRGGSQSEMNMQQLSMMAN